MALTPAQLATLKAAIVADSELNAFPMNSDGAFAIAAALNQIASPEWIVWRTNVTRREVLQNGFDWTRLDNLSVGKARVWSDIFVDGEINPSKPNVRAGIDSVWVGTQADLDVRAAVYVHCKTKATRIQKILSTGTGTNATPATMGDGIDEGFQLSFADVTTARQLP
jgi:hypothetical protein